MGRSLQASLSISQEIELHFQGCIIVIVIVAKLLEESEACYCQGGTGSSLLDLFTHSP